MASVDDHVEASFTLRRWSRLHDVCDEGASGIQEICPKNVEILKSCQFDRIFERDSTYIQRKLIRCVVVK